MKGGYFEEYLKKYVDLPVVEGEESGRLASLWERIKELRANIPETALALEREFNMELQEKKMGEYLKDAEEGKNKEVEEEKEEEDVYIDSESDEEEALPHKK